MKLIIDMRDKKTIVNLIFKTLVVLPNTDVRDNRFLSIIRNHDKTDFSNFITHESLYDIISNLYDLMIHGNDTAYYAHAEFSFGNGPYCYTFSYTSPMGHNEIVKIRKSDLKVEHIINAPSELNKTKEIVDTLDMNFSGKYIYRIRNNSTGKYVQNDNNTVWFKMGWVVKKLKILNKKYANGNFIVEMIPDEATKHIPCVDFISAYDKKIAEDNQKKINKQKLKEAFIKIKSIDAAIANLSTSKNELIKFIENNKKK